MVIITHNVCLVYVLFLNNFIGYSGDDVTVVFTIWSVTCKCLLNILFLPW